MKLNAGWLKLLAIAAVLGFFCATLQAEDKKASATGTWKWTRKNQNGDEQQLQVKLKQDGDKLTGTLTGPGGNDVEVKEGKVKDGEVSFQVTFERDGNEITAKFHGKLDGDKIKGKVEVGDRKLDWEPTRAKDDK